MWHCGFFNAGAYNVLMGHLRLGMAGGVGVGSLEAGDYAKWFNLAAWFTAYVRQQQVNPRSRCFFVSAAFNSQPRLECVTVLQ